MSKTLPRNPSIAALDIGTTKVACFIASRDEDDELHVIGVGHHRAKGMRGGQVINLDEAEASVRAAVDAAEQMAAARIDKVFVNMSCGTPQSTRVDVELAVSGHQIRDTDVRRVLDQRPFQRAASGPVALGRPERRSSHRRPPAADAQGNRVRRPWRPERQA